MILISHRGNLNGKSDRENQPDYIEEALAQGFDVEIDVWRIDNLFYLGHDEPVYLVEEDFLRKSGLWCHAKNIDALNQMVDVEMAHCFWHQEDDVTLTSEGYLWTYSGKQLTSNSIAVLPTEELNVDVAGVCSDFIVRFI